MLVAQPGPISRSPNENSANINEIIPVVAWDLTSLHFNHPPPFTPLPSFCGNPTQPRTHLGNHDIPGTRLQLKIHGAGESQSVSPALGVPHLGKKSPLKLWTNRNPWFFGRPSVRVQLKALPVFLAISKHFGLPYCTFIPPSLDQRSSYFLYSTQSQYTHS